MSIQFIALETTEVRALQSGGPDINGQVSEHQISTGGTPCRHCLSDVPEGQPYLIMAYRPFPAPQPYAEQGPIFLHETQCTRHRESRDIPEILNSPQYLVRGYNDQDRIVYGSGQIVQTDKIPAIATEMFLDQRIAYIHVRSASNNCYQCRINRA